MLRRIAQSTARQFGFAVHNIDRLGIDMEADLVRLCGDRSPRCIIDVGANVGQTALALSDRFASATVYSFEPVPDTFATFKANTAAIRRIVGFNQAMGAESGSAEIYLADASVRNSLVRSSNPAAKAITIEVTTLDTFCTANKIELIDLLKIDVEGFELAVLAGGKTILESGRARFLFVECNFAPTAEMPQADFFELVDVLRPKGYCVAGVYSESFALKKGSLHCNILFAHRASLPASVAPARVANIF